jgi:hypothetical protein
MPDEEVPVLIVGGSLGDIQPTGGIIAAIAQTIR